MSEKKSKIFEYYEENNDFTNPTGDAPNDIGFREITDGIKSEIEWSSEVIKYDTL